MPQPDDLQELQYQADLDHLLARLRRWSDHPTNWQPLSRTQALVHRALEQSKTILNRAERPLVVATFGGTGTGKSSLTNALAGETITATGRERPTTRRPVLVLHESMQPETLDLPLDDMLVLRSNANQLQDFALLDCPDPDTSEDDQPGENLAILRAMLPYCDVLLYTTTQQKYRSHRILEELGSAAEGVRLLFVQTHAGVDADIREDWQTQLSSEYEVPEVFFIDSVAALKQQREGKPLDDEFRRLMETLEEELSHRGRGRVRQSNLLNLLQSAVGEGQQRLNAALPAVEAVDVAMSEQQQRVTVAMTSRLQNELINSRALWERRLLTAVTERWGASPFSAMLRIYSGLGNLIASMTFMRARNTAQMALVGAVQGARWLHSRQEESEAQQRTERAIGSGIDDDLLMESRFVISESIGRAELDRQALIGDTAESMQQSAGRMAEDFLDYARDRIEEIISQLAERNSSWFVRIRYELAFGIYLLFVILRIGSNFFWESFLRPIISSANAAPLLGVDFYIAAGVILLIWSAILVTMFTRRLRNGLTSKIKTLADELARKKLPHTLFPKVRSATDDARKQTEELGQIQYEIGELQMSVHKPSLLGAKRTAVKVPTAE
ncbi:GTPase [Calycomorphotria hydatis]|uniref:G domain-containing protein n=1 Tax=Calycomorphotria hydatis TaxID=2528027 RepID=A0A517T4M3_9PLAN|nr:GTPase [Calycomorphotria hydatis]QDT63333.1 hypothetical protein V22_05540 [Calycomorphotria hydatis]